MARYQIWLNRYRSAQTINTKFRRGSGPAPGSIWFGSSIKIRTPAKAAIFFIRCLNFCWLETVLNTSLEEAGAHSLAPIGLTLRRWVALRVAQFGRYAVLRLIRRSEEHTSELQSL